MSMFSKFIDKVLPGDPMQNLTQSTTDKFLAPETKDIAEMVAALATGMGAVGNIGSATTAWTGSQTIGSMASNAALAALGGGDPKQGAIMAGAGAMLGNLPGGLGTFFAANPIGQNLIQAFASSGGNMGAISNILGNLGFGGKQKDVIEQVLALMALAGISKEFAKDALSKANLLESQELDTINEMLTTARSIVPTDANDELLYRKLADTTASEYRQVHENFVHELSTKGMLDTNIAAGQLRRIGQEAAAANLENRREIMLSRPERSAAALTAMGTALTPLDAMAQRARATAEEQRMLPFNIARDLYAANRKTPEDLYYEAKIAEMQGQGAVGAAGVTPAMLPVGIAAGLSSATGMPSAFNGALTNFASGTVGNALQARAPAPAPAQNVWNIPWGEMSAINNKYPSTVNRMASPRPQGNAFNLTLPKLNTRFAY